MAAAEETITEEPACIKSQVVAQDAGNLAATIASIYLPSDCFGKTYRIYGIVVTHKELRWQVWRRFNDFQALHSLIWRDCDSDIRKKLPPPPGKTFGLIHIFHDPMVKWRIESLSNYLDELLSMHEFQDNPHLLCFLGAASTGKLHLTLGGGRSTTHFYTLPQAVDWGDVFLFQCDAPVSKLQRTLTGSHWDHLGLVVRRGEGAPLELLEATSDGVVICELLSRVSAYNRDGFARRIGFRRLLIERTPEMLVSLCEFIKECLGKPYGFTLETLLGRLEVHDLLGGLGRLLTGQQNISSSGEDTSVKLIQVEEPSIESDTPKTEVEDIKDQDKSSFFCSEVVAMGLRRIGALRGNSKGNGRRRSSTFFPGDFIEGGCFESELEEGITLDALIEVDCLLPEVAWAFEEAERLEKVHGDKI